MIKAIVFDLAGVIYTMGFSFHKEFEVIRGYWNKAKVGEISNDDFLKLGSEKFNSSVENFVNFFWDNNELIPGMQELIIKLGEKYKIGFLANLAEEVYKSDKDLWDFESFGESVMSFREKVKKPDVEAIELIINKLGVEKEEIIYVDDKPETIEKYSEYGVKCVKFDSKKQLIEDLKKLGVEL